jgi:cytochrome c peroxidase
MKHRLLFAAVLPIAFALTASAADAPDAAKLRTEALQVLAALPDKMPGADADTPARVKLGEKLFFDKRLSVNNKQACNSCHRVDANLGGVDNDATSEGAFGKRGDRNAPTVLNAGFHLAQFWDGRAPSLQAQAKGPVLNPGEMAMPNEAEVVKRLSADKAYQGMFAAAFPATKPAITYDNMAEAIAAFERTLRTNDRFDDFLKGDNKALSAAELAGLQTFLATGCTTCHNGPALGGNSYQKVGLVKPYENTSDLGRFNVTKDNDDKFKFKVPSLRNIAITGPYFHDGKMATLDQAVKKMADMQLGKELSAAETSQIVAFLNSLTDKKRGAKKTVSAK